LPFLDMTRDAFPLSNKGVPERLLSELAACRGPAFVIEPFSGRVQAANATGAEALGLERDGLNAALDGTMPALHRLREIARTAAPLAVCRENLVFWTPQGPLSLACNVTVTAEAAAAPLLVVQAAAPRPPVPNDGGEGPALESHDPDAAKLREIARRIREGQKALAPPRELPPDEDIVAVQASAPDGSATAGGAPGSEASEPSSAPEASDSIGPRPAPPLAPSLAHELRTPLAAIIAAAEIMKDERLGPVGNTRYRGYAADIHDGARHALSVIERMLGALDGAAERPALEFADIDLNALAQSAASQVMPLAERAGLTLTTELAPHLPSLVADATSMKQILFNLLTNALKFTASGGRIKVVTCTLPDGSIAIEVRDTGPGMSKREIARSLDAVNPPCAGPQPAGGLGLPLARALAEANGARLSIESALGRGTAARVTFARNRLIAV
jgi:two-component sensor histidine kinase